jgi:probable addiction module antidote protein
MKKSEVTRLDIAEYLDSKEIVAEYLDLICQENDPALLLHAIGHVARSKGMAKIAESSGLGRESLYKALAENAHPRFETVFKVLAALGIQMHLVPRVKFKRRRTPTPIATAEKKSMYKV